jgi:hypothetical protein
MIGTHGSLPVRVIVQFQQSDLSPERISQPVSVNPQHIPSNGRNDDQGRLCDYASAGRTWNAESVLRVWLPQPLNLTDPFEGITSAKAE